MWKRTFLIGVPRSGSVALTRSLEPYYPGGIFHEPFVPVYAKATYKGETKDWFKPNSFSTSEEVIQAIQKEQRDVLVKDMSFAVWPYLSDILQTIPEAKFILLYRYPRHVIVSLLQKWMELHLPFHLDQYNDVIGFNQLRLIHEKLGTLTSLLPEHKMMVSNTDDLGQSLQDIGSFLQLPLTVDTAWQPLSKTEDWEEKAKLWREQKTTHLFQKWHYEALQSNGLKGSKSPLMNLYRYLEQIRR